MYRISALLLTLALSAPAAAEIYKCEIDGSTTFQGTPCPDGTGGAHETAPLSRMEGGVDHALQARMEARAARERREASQQAAAANRRYVERKQQQQQARAARRAGIVPEGASESTALSRYGRPDRTNVSQGGNGTCKFHYWDEPYRRIMICDGKVANSYSRDVD